MVSDWPLLVSGRTARPSAISLAAPFMSTPGVTRTRDFLLRRQETNGNDTVDPLAVIGALTGVLSLTWQVRSYIVDKRPAARMLASGVTADSNCLGNVGIMVSIVNRGRVDIHVETIGVVDTLTRGDVPAGPAQGFGFESPVLPGKRETMLVAEHRLDGLSGPFAPFATDHLGNRWTGKPIHHQGTSSRDSAESGTSPRGTIA